MKDIAIYGTGGLGREISCLIDIINQNNTKWNLIGFFDDRKPVGTQVENSSIIGGIDIINNYPHDLDVVIAIGNSSAIKSVASSINNDKISFPNIISPDLLVYNSIKNLSIGKGNLICPRSLISTKVHIGSFNLFNAMFTAGHDTTIGDYNVFMPSVNVSGNANIGNENFFGVKSTILQGINIGNNTRVGASSVIMRDTKDNNLYMGNPATIMTF